MLWWLLWCSPICFLVPFLFSPKHFSKWRVNTICPPPWNSPIFLPPTASILWWNPPNSRCVWMLNLVWVAHQPSFYWQTLIISGGSPDRPCLSLTCPEYLTFILSHQLMHDFIMFSLNPQKTIQVEMLVNLFKIRSWTEGESWKHFIFRATPVSLAWK